MQEDAQLRTYEAVAEEWGSGIHFHLLLNNRWVLDNRIPAKAMAPDPQTDPVGDRYELLPTGVWPHYDDHSYTFDGDSVIYDATPDDDTDDNLDVTVRVLYLINTSEYSEIAGIPIALIGVAFYLALGLTAWLGWRDRQGNDRGASYRSEIFYCSEDQKAEAFRTIDDVNASGLWPGEVVTRVSAVGDFWEAEPEHQDYLERIPNGYTCHFPRADWVLPKRDLAS